MLHEVVRHEVEYAARVLLSHDRVYQGDPCRVRQQERGKSGVPCIVGMPVMAVPVTMMMVVIMVAIVYVR